MQQWIPKQKILIVSGLSVLMGLLAYLSGLYIINIKIGEIKSAYYANQIAIAEGEKAKVIADIALIHTQSIQTLRDFFIKAGDKVDFIEKIEEVGRKSGAAFSISSISEEKTKQGALKEDIFLKIEAEGPWKSIMSLIKDLESMPFGVRFTDINLDTKKPGNWKSSMEITVFRESK